MAHPTKSGRIRKYICTSCRTIFCERTNTVFYDLRTEEDTVLLALKMLLNGMSLRSIARILEISLDTVRRWLSRAANQSEEVNEVLLRELDISKVELDELWTIVEKKLHRGAITTKMTNMDLDKPGFGMSFGDRPDHWREKPEYGKQDYSRNGQTISLECHSM